MDQLIHVDMDQLIRALEQTLSPDQYLLDASYRYLEAVARGEDSFAWLAAALADLAVGSHGAAPSASAEKGERALRQQAAIQLKNLVRHSGCRWLQLELHQRSRTKMVLLGGLVASQASSELDDRRCSSALSQCIQAVAELELPHGTWSELIPQLVALVINNGNSGGLMSNNKVLTRSPTEAAAAAVAGSLETLGFICETVSPACLEPHVNQLLTAVVYGMQEAAFPAAVNLAAVRALTPLLSLATANFARRPERNHIIQV
jgi:importin subunit beta-1